VTRRDFVPTQTEATGPYWEATRRQSLLLQWCPRCETHVHHPREACPRCLNRDLTWRESDGLGTVHAVSVHYRPFEAMPAEACPYAVAFVDLDDGVRFLSNIVGCDPETVHAGQRVRLTWEPVGDGYHLPVFSPDQR
jgi:uncharacterized OB-fold protein